MAILFYPLCGTEEDSLAAQQQCNGAAMALARVRRSQVMQGIQRGSEVRFSSSFKDETKAWLAL